MGKPSLKKTIISFYSQLPTAVKDLEKNDLIVYTASGIICGKLISEDTGTITNQVFFNLTSDITKTYRTDNSLSDTEPLEDNDGYIMLENVVVHDSGRTFNTPFIIVFIDQIIGISLGNLQI